jgi:hypothetical protein
MINGRRSTRRKRRPRSGIQSGASTLRKTDFLRASPSVSLPQGILLSSRRAAMSKYSGGPHNQQQADPGEDTSVGRPSPGTLVRMALNEIVEEHLDFSVFEHRYRNDDTGRSACNARLTLKVVLYGCYCGTISTRRLGEPKRPHTYATMSR